MLADDSVASVADQGRCCSALLRSGVSLGSVAPIDGCRRLLRCSSARAWRFCAGQVWAVDRSLAGARCAIRYQVIRKNTAACSSHESFVPRISVQRPELQRRLRVRRPRAENSLRMRQYVQRPRNRRTRTHEHNGSVAESVQQAEM